MKKVLLIGSELGKGGAERSISLLSYYLEKEDYDVTLCILSGKDRDRFYKTCDRVIFIDPPEHTTAWGKIKAWRHRFNKIRTIKKDHDIDVSISFLEGPDYVNIMTKGREKVVLSIRGSKMFDKVIAGTVGKLRKKLLIPFLYRKANQIVTVSMGLEKELKKYFNIPESRLKTIYNFYENEAIIKLSNEPLTPEEQKLFSKPVIITSGRLHVSKAQDSLLRILKKVKKKADARLMILGDGELRDYLISLAEELSLTVCDWESTNTYTDADVYLMGYQANAFKFYRHSKMFALSSSWEGFPNVFAEALICNIPVVTTDCYTGPRELLNITHLGDKQVEEAVRTEVGSLLPMLDVIEDNRFNVWADEIIYRLQAPKPSAGEFDKLTQRFTLDCMLAQWKEVIEN